MPLTKRASDKFKPFKHCTQENKLGLLSHLGCGIKKTPLSLREQATLSLTGPVTGAATARHLCNIDGGQVIMGCPLSYLTIKRSNFLNGHYVLLCRLSANKTYFEGFHRNK